MVKCIRTTRAERESAVHPDDLARRRRLSGYAKLSPDETRWWDMTDRNGEPLKVGDEVLLRGPGDDEASLVQIVEELANNEYPVQFVVAASTWTPADLPVHDGVIDANFAAVEAGRATRPEPIVVAGTDLEVFEYDDDE